MSVSHLPFLKRLRTSLGKGERNYLCSDTSFAPLAVLAHFSFTPNERRRLRRSRSTLAASTERVRHISQCSVDEFKPFDFPKDADETVEYSFGNLLGRRRLFSPSNQAVGRIDRRESQFLDAKLFPQHESSALDDSLLTREISFEEKDEVEWEDGSTDQYDPITFEDVEAARKTIIRTHGFVGITFHFQSTEAVKMTSNERFVEKYPRVDITYSKFKSIKRDLVTLGELCKMDLITTSQAIVYFEKIVLKDLISKPNRKLVAGTAFLVSVKLNVQ